MEDLEHGGTATQEPSDLDVLREYGVDEEVLERVSKGLMRQDDYTRKTQELSREREQLLQERAYFQGLAAGGGKQQEEQSDFERFISDMLSKNDTPETREVASTLRALNSAQKAEFQKELQRATAPVTEHLRKSEASSTLDEWCKGNLIPKFGDEVMRLMTPAIRNHIIGEMVSGHNVDPEALLRRVSEDKMEELRQRVKQAQNQKNATRHTEGHTVVRRAQPPMSGGGPRASQKDVPAGFDAHDAANSILRSMGINR